MKRKRTTKTRKKPHKGIKLSSGVWVKSTEIKALRDSLLNSQGGICAVTSVNLETGALDHDHTSGKIRGVLLDQCNLLEGRYLKLFNKARLNTKYGLTFADFLINLGSYLKEGSSEARLHYKHMEDFRKRVARNTIPELKVMLQCDFGIEVEGDKGTLVQAYVQEWVNQIEEK